MDPQIIVILLGIISSVTLVISALSVHRMRLLGFSLITGTLVAIEYGLMGSWTGLASVTIGLAWTLIAFSTGRFPSLNHPLFVPVFILLQSLAFTLVTDWHAQLNPIVFVPLLGGIGGVIGVYMKEVLHMKAIFIICGMAWLGYEFSTGVYGQMIGESINLVANTIAFSALLTAKRRGIPETAMQNLDTQFIETITGAIGLPSHTRPLPVVNYDRYPAASQRGTKKPIRGAHPQSVGYARMTAEYDRARDMMLDDLVRKFEAMDEQERGTAPAAKIHA